MLPPIFGPHSLPYQVLIKWKTPFFKWFKKLITNLVCQHNVISLTL
jgi:hypothetical protein